MYFNIKFCMIFHMFAGPITLTGVFQLVLLQGMSHFSAFLQRLETRDKVLGTSNMYR